MCSYVRVSISVAGLNLRCGDLAGHVIYSRHVNSRNLSKIALEEEVFENLRGGRSAAGGNKDDCHSQAAPSAARCRSSTPLATTRFAVPPSGLSSCVPYPSHPPAPPL